MIPTNTPAVRSERQLVAIISALASSLATLAAGANDKGALEQAHRAQKLLSGEIDELETDEPLPEAAFAFPGTSELHVTAPRMESHPDGVCPPENGCQDSVCLAAARRAADPETPKPMTEAELRGHERPGDAPAVSEVDEAAKGDEILPEDALDVSSSRPPAVSVNDLAPPDGVKPISLGELMAIPKGAAGDTVIQEQIDAARGDTPLPPPPAMPQDLAPPTPGVPEPPKETT